MRTIIFFGCFLVVAGSAWAQFGEDLQQPARQLQPNPPGYLYGQLAASSTPESLKGFNAWFQQQRERNRQQHLRSQQYRQLQPNPSGYSYRQRPVPYTRKPLQGFDAWFQQQREQNRQQHLRSQREARQHELDQMYRLREYDRLRRGPLRPY
jgi:hypothetical protein